MAETLAREHREEEHGAGPTTEEHSLMQSRKQLKRGAGRRRGGEPTEESLTTSGERDVPSSSWTTPARPSTSDMGADGGRDTRGDPIPREEHLTDEDPAIMTAVRIAWFGNC